MGKHLTLEDRAGISSALKLGKSFKEIGRIIEKDCTTISKEVRGRLMTKKTGCYGNAYNACLLRFDCHKNSVCTNIKCKIKKCKNCNICNDHCLDFIKQICTKLLNPPYVCDACTKRSSCTLEKQYYSPVTAQDKYKKLLSESRSGIGATEEEITQMDKLISPLLKKGHSLHNICANNKDSIILSEKTLYNYMDYSLFSAFNLDMPRKVRYRKRKKTVMHKVDRKFIINRTYGDFQSFLKENEDIPVVEMDSVEGKKGGKVLLTIHFKQAQFMLAFIREANNSKSVIDIFNNLDKILGRSTFQLLFPVILADRGTEFTNPTAIEFDEAGNQRTRIFYCDPSAPHQKGAAENNHEFIRRIIPKGNPLDSFEQNHITLMMSHVNSYSRNKLNDKTPFSLFEFLYGKEVLEKLGVEKINSNDVILKPSLLKKQPDKAI